LDYIIEKLDLLNKYSSLILVIATAIYVYFTVRLAKETRKLREVETHPFISLELGQLRGSSILSLKIRNIGKAPAYNITFEIEDEFKDLFRFNFKNKINYFAPQQEIECVAKHYNELNELDTSSVPIKVSYSSKDKQNFEEIFYLEWSSLDGVLLEKNPPEEISKNLEKIYKELEKFNRENEKKGNFIVSRIGLIEIEQKDFYLNCIFSNGFIGKINKDKMKSFGLSSFENIYLYNGQLRDTETRIIISPEELYNKLQ